MITLQRTLSGERCYPGDTPTKGAERKRMLAAFRSGEFPGDQQGAQ